MPSVHRRVYWLGLAPTYYDFSRFFLSSAFLSFFFFSFSFVFFFFSSPGKGETPRPERHEYFKKKKKKIDASPR